MTPDPQLAPALTRALSGDAAPGGPEAEIDERILHAALELIGAYGKRRTSIDDIAERAGVGRATVFRRFGSKDAVIERLFAREARSFIAEFSRTMMEGPDAGSRVVEAFVYVVRHFGSHPLLARLARVEPQALIEGLRGGDPSPFEIGTAFVAGRLRLEHLGGATPAGDADLLAEALIRFTLSYLLVPGRGVELDDDERLREFARAALVPMIR